MPTGGGTLWRKVGGVSLGAILAFLVLVAALTSVGVAG